MKFKLFFLILTIYTLSKTIQLQSYPLLWLTLNFAIMTLSYSFNKPSYIMGKKQKGEINRALLILNLPWLLFTWSIFRLQMLLSRENRVDEIVPNHIYIGSRPLGGFDYGSYDLVVDLTAEFFKDDVESNRYICYPNLDAIALAQSYESVELFRNKKILVHCANGHGRSALFVARLLIDLELVENFEEGLALVKKHRPLAVPNTEQKNLNYI